MEQITVGLDFGTHQTKVCIERKEGAVCSYEFMTFTKEDGKTAYTLPSVVNISRTDRVTYGFITETEGSETVRYFKQSVFRATRPGELDIYYAVWYVAYILFDLERRFGQNFAVQMGVPTDSSHLETARRTAVSIVASAYRLVEDVFGGDKARFMATGGGDLLGLTEIVPGTQEVKDEYQILVFPEAYACLRPLTSVGRIASGMSLLIDIGGGTTDISFFTIARDGTPGVYDFFSINKGLNYLAGTVEWTWGGTLDPERRKAYCKEIAALLGHLIRKLTWEFHQQTSFDIKRLKDALRNRPLIYCGGGSTIRKLRRAYCDFTDCKQVSAQHWKREKVAGMEQIEFLGLCPILSTAYGLAISVAHDNIRRLPLADIFAGIRGGSESNLWHRDDNTQNAWGAFGGVTPYEDYDSIK